MHFLSDKSGMRWRTEGGKKNVTFSLPSRLRLPSLRAERNLKAAERQRKPKINCDCYGGVVCNAYVAAAEQEPLNQPAPWVMAKHRGRRAVWF